MLGSNREGFRVRPCCRKKCTWEQGFLGLSKGAKDSGRVAKATPERWLEPVWNVAQLPEGCSGGLLHGKKSIAHNWGKTRGWITCAFPRLMTSGRIFIALSVSHDASQWKGPVEYTCKSSNNDHAHVNLPVTEARHSLVPCLEIRYSGQLNSLHCQGKISSALCDDWIRWMAKGLKLRLTAVLGDGWMCVIYIVSA